MRLLVIGGTRFVGKHFVEQAQGRGHDVTVFHRGVTGEGLFPGIEHRLGDRNNDLSALSTGTWDATVDTCAYIPRQVHALADALGGRGGHHLVVSSVSVYATPEGPGIDEDAELIRLDDPTVEDVTGETYGGLKVLCEEAAVERHGDATLVVRPTFVVGPDDHTWRFPWWVTRIARGGRVPVPGPRDTPAQLIDARDLGSWMVRLLEDNRSGAFNGCGPRVDFRWGEQIETIAASVAPEETEIVWVEADTILGHDLPPMALPLWGGLGPERWIMTCDPARAVDAGLAFRPLDETVRDTLRWAESHLTGGSNPVPSMGMSPDQEQALLAESRKSG